MSRLQDVIQRGTRAGQPAATTVAAGTIYFVTGENVLERSSGSAWESISAAAASSSGGLSSGYALSLLNNVEEVEPILIPGPQGIQGVAGGAGASGIQVARVALTEAQIESWNSSPIQLLAGQGADKIIVPVQLAWEANITTSYPENINVNLVYAGSSTLLTVNMSAAVNQVQRRLLVTYINLYDFVYATFDPRNKAVQLKGGSNLTATGVGTGIANMAYYVIQTS